MIDRLDQQLGNYRLIRSLGSGGFADVYLGEHLYLNTQAAIKMLQTRLAQHDLQAFLAEARTIANLTHRNIVQVLEFGIEKDTPFLVMTYAPNGTLRQRHPNGSRLSPSEVVSYIGQVADALQYAHERKVIHRDVKPENMLVGQNGDILLSDFGIAVVAQSSRYSRQEVGGTAAYMSPEQLQGRASPASDQYALAVTAYEWLTGERPFTGSFAEICSQHLLAAPVPLCQKVPSLSPAVEQVILIALNKDPQKRFASVQAFANALAQASTMNQGGYPLTAYNNAALAEEQISTMVKPPSLPTPPHSSFTYPASSNPSQGNTPSFTYPASNQSQGSNVNTPHLTQFGMSTSGKFPPQGLPIQQENKRRGNKGMRVAIIALVVLLVAVASAGGIYVLTGAKALSTGGVGKTLPNTTSTQSSQPGASNTPASVSTSPTGVPTSSIPTALPTTTSSNYSAIQPGPGCDKNEGTWTPQGFSNITCGTQLTPSTIRTQTYLYFQLPQNQAFSSDNSIGITGGNLGGAPNDTTRTGNCVGLAEQDASTGFLAEYCATGAWLIYSISSNGAIVQVLEKGLTSTRTSEILLLIVKGTTLSFSIDSEVHSVSITPIQPTRVAIADNSDTDVGFAPGTISVENFNYIKLS